MGLRPFLPVGWSLPVDATHLAVIKAQGPGMPDPGTQRGAITLLVFDLADQGVDTLTNVLGRELHIEGFDRGVNVYPTPFGPETFVATGEGFVWVGDSETPTIQCFQSSDVGSPVAVVSPFESRRISRSDQSRMREAYSSRYSGDTQKRWARYARAMDFPDEMPRFGDLKVDRLGNLWVQEYQPFWEEEDQHWAVFSPGGQHLADVTIPPNALPDCARRAGYSCSHLNGIFEIGEDYILVPQSDEWGVRFVRKYAIEKPS